MEKDLSKLTSKEIEKMDYNQMIGLTRETNRTPGGTETIKQVARALLLNQDTKLLDIGTSTGHTALEFSRLVNCEVTGIDINEMSLATARKRAEKLGLKKAKFIKEDATNMSFEDNTFDVVFAGNVTSLVDDRNKALEEYWRVLKPNGYLVAVPMYYIKQPSRELVGKVRDAIQVPIQVYYKQDWKEFFHRKDTEIYEEMDYEFLRNTDEEIQKFCESILSREHLKTLNQETKHTLETCYIEYMNLFNDNLSHMGFTIFILRKKESEEFNDPQLYFSRRL